MTSFEKAVGFILEHEGGYVNHPSDPGGETNFGISKRAHPSVDIRALTAEKASQIYKQEYWDKCRCGEMPFQVALVLFDSAVNQGPSAAIRLLQQSLGVKVDGVLGPVTMQAIQNAQPKRLLCGFIARRAYRYAMNPEVRTFGQGWFTRLAECHQAAMEPF